MAHAAQCQSVSYCSWVTGQPMPNMPSKRVWPNYLNNRCFTAAEIQHHSVSGLHTLAWKEISTSNGVTRQYDVQLSPDMAMQKRRILGKPHCIACHGNIFIFQYNFIQVEKKVNKSAKMGFLFVDYGSGMCQRFEDATGYFHASHTSQRNQESIQCLISPGLTMVLFRLSQKLLKPTKWSAVQFAAIHPIKCDNGTLECTSWRIDDLKLSATGSGYRDRKTQAIAFDPRFKHRLVFINTDYYCSAAKVEVYEPQTDCSIAKLRQISETKTVRLNDTGNFSFVEGTSLPKKGFDPDLVIQEETILVNTMAEFSQSGYFIAMWNEVQMTIRTDTKETSFKQLHAYILDSNDFNVCKWCKVDLPHKQSKSDTPFETEYGCRFTNNGGALVMGRVTPEGVRPSRYLQLPIVFYLKEICRRTILNNVSEDDIEKLPLPLKLMGYLKFDHMVCRHCKTKGEL